MPVNFVYKLQIPNVTWGLQGLGTPHLWEEYDLSASGIKYYMIILNKIDGILLYWTSNPPKKNPLFKFFHVFIINISDIQRSL